MIRGFLFNFWFVLKDLIFEYSCHRTNNVTNYDTSFLSPHCVRRKRKGRSIMNGRIHNFSALNLLWKHAKQTILVIRGKATKRTQTINNMIPYMIPTSIDLQPLKEMFREGTFVACIYHHRKVFILKRKRKRTRTRK